MKEVQNKWNTLKLNDDIWAKLIYFEQNRRLAKAYVSAPVLTVDGSTNGLDGFRIGLSGIDNSYRNLDSIDCLRSIGQGIKLKIDNQGNILIRKVSSTSLGLKATQPSNRCSVWVKDWPTLAATTTALNSGTKLSSALVQDCKMHEIEQSDISYKLFDMKKFRLQLEMRRQNNENTMDWRHCVSIISFVKNGVGKENEEQNSGAKAAGNGNLLEDPCWLMIINIIAIDMLKSITCDIDSPTNKSRASTLVQNHGLLESRNHPSRIDQVQSNQYANKLRTSSSASILLPAASNIESSNSNHKATNGADISVNNLPFGDRIKKLRTTNRGPSPINAYRRCQSTKQLSSLSSSNNTIYTTFTGKYTNNNMSAKAWQTDNSSTSDYNSASRSSSSGSGSGGQKGAINWRLQPYQPAIEPLQQRVQFNGSGSSGGGSRYRETSSDRRTPIASTNKLLMHSDHSHKNLSLSAFDLSQKRLDLRSIQTSIRMNYDYDVPDESTIFDDTDYEHTYLNNKTVSNHYHHRQSSNYKPVNGGVISSSRQAIISLNNRLNLNPAKLIVDELSKQTCCCEITEKLKNDSRDTVNHNECRAMHGHDLSVTTTATPKKEVSRSSIGSSGSSSSGCADNDYFMSNSTSSMSSSTSAMSNERELLSQPTSGSGIVCSGSTSDEYDESSGRKVSSKSPVVRTLDRQASDATNPEEVIDSSSDNSKESNKTGQKFIKKPPSSTPTSSNKANRRGYKMKTVGHIFSCQDGDGQDCCDCGLSDYRATETFEQCDCPSLVEPSYNCDCCQDCGAQPEQVQPTELQHELCECSEGLEPIYNRLPHPSSVSNNKLSSDKCMMRSNTSPKDSSMGKHRISSLTDLSCSSKDFLPTGISTIPMHDQRDDNNKWQQSTSPTKDMKTGVGWLEKRKYSRIFPRFIFSSSSSSSSSGGDRNQIDAQRVSTSKSKQRKGDNINDKDGKSRLSRSTQDLC